MKKNQTLIAHVAGMLLTGMLLAACTGGPALQFSNYEKTADATTPDGVPAEIQLSLAIAQSDDGDAVAANILEAEKKIIAASALAEELGEPEGATLQAIADEYLKRFADGMSTGDLPAPCVYDLKIACGYMNDRAIVFNVTDGVYGNGGPQEYIRVVSLKDGRIMERSALTTMSEGYAIRLGMMYGDKGLKEYLTEMKPDEFWIAPDSAGCKVKMQTGGHFFAEFTVPTERIAQYLTDEGKAIFDAK